ncbi:MAG TPA: SRPBCC domain-containing protein [Methylomirabilota bacterium]
MRTTREIAITATPAALWTLLWDVPRMVECVPGCVEAREMEPHRRYTARMTQKIGLVSLTVPLDVEIVAAQPPRHLTLHAKGRDPVLGAEIKMQVTLDIDERESGSVLRVDVVGRVLGKLGALGHGVIEGKAEATLDEFGVRLRKAARV